MSESTVSELFCPACGYNLRGIESVRCPECGVEVDRAALAQFNIPWTLRNQIGNVRAFRRTVWQVLWHPIRTGQQAARAVDHREAQKFRWAVVMVAAIPLCIALLICRASAGSDMRTVALNPFSYGNIAVTNTQPNMVAYDLLFCLVAAWESWIVPSIAVVLWLAGLSGVSTYFFHPRSLSAVQQNRAIAISDYACAPLAYLGVLVAAWGTVITMNVLNLGANNTASPGFEIAFILVVLTVAVAGLGTPALMVWLWVATLRVLKGATHCSTIRILFTAALLPLLWILITLLTLVVFPMACGFVRLLVMTYWA